MSTIILPGEVAAEIAGEAEAGRMVDFTNRLKAIDPRLDLILWDKPDQDGLRKGFYAIRRHNDDGTKSTWLVHEGGRFSEPHEGHLEAFRRYDTWARPDQFRRDREKANRERESRRKSNAQAKHDQFRELADYAFVTKRAFPKGIPK